MKTYIRFLIILILVVNLSKYSKAQTLSNYEKTFPIKEAYDGWLEKNSTIVGNNSISIYNWGVRDQPLDYENIPMLLLSYLNLYDATDDKCYLNKFIQYSYLLQYKKIGSNYFFSNQGDVTSKVYSYNSTEIPMWPANFYNNGRILWAMARYVYLLNTNNTILSNTNIPTGFVPIESWDDTDISTYGNFATWLKVKVCASLNFINYNFWIDNSNYYDKYAVCGHTFATGSGCNVTTAPSEINMQAGVICAMLYIYKVDNSYYDYFNKADAFIHNFYYNVLFHDTYNDTYKWHHNPLNTDLKEDIGHGAFDIQVPLISYNLFGANHPNYFSSTEMFYFRNTFTKNLFDQFQSNGDAKFFNSVYKTTYPISNGTQGFPGCDNQNYIPDNTHNCNWGEVLAWMELQQFDTGSGNYVYNTLLQHTVSLLDDSYISYPEGLYNNHFCRNTSNLTGGESVWGLSNVVKTQWDNECTNMTLKNRDLYYNQDFSVKNDLIISPQSPNNPESIATPYNASFESPNYLGSSFTAQEFIVRSNVTTNITAGNKIVLKPGFKTETGCQLHASINPALCGAQSKKNNQEDITTLIKKDTILNDSSFDNNSLKIYPNPFFTFCTIEYDLPSTENVKISIYNAANLNIEELVDEMQTEGTHKIIWDATDKTGGVYYCLVKTSKLSLIKKIILIK